MAWLVTVCGGACRDMDPKGARRIGDAADGANITAEARSQIGRSLQPIR